jgi:hypothetical protein
MCAQVDDRAAKVRVERVREPEMAEAPGHTDERVLDDVARELGVRGDEVREPHGSRSVALVQLRETGRAGLGADPFGDRGHAAPSVLPLL